MNVTISKSLEIDVGHRLMGHEGKCRNAHGHRYQFIVECHAAKLDDVGRVIDFGVIKKELGSWLDDKWDHGFIYQEGDPIGSFLGNDGQKVYELTTPPTVENISMEFLRIARFLMAKHNIGVKSITVYETPTCWAIAT